MSKVNTERLIHLTSTWAFTVDTNGNHQPYELKPTENKDGVKSEKWFGVDVYYNNVGMLLQWIITTELSREGASKEIDNVKEYLTRFKEIATIYSEINANINNKLGV